MGDARSIRRIPLPVHAVPDDAKRRCHPAPIVRYGDTADGILKVATEIGADLIVLGVRDAADPQGVLKFVETIQTLDCWARIAAER